MFNLVLNSLHKGSCLSTALSLEFMVGEILGALVIIVLIYKGLRWASRRERHD